MISIGLELTDSGAIAVALHPDGRVEAKTQATAPNSRDAARRAIAGLSTALKKPLKTAAVAVAAQTPGAATAIDVVRVLASDLPASAVSGPVASGTAAAAAEAWVGAARGSLNVAFLGVTDHTMAGIILNGEPLTGANRRALQVAWLALNPVEREDYRKVGCLEAEVASFGIVKRLVWRIKAGDHSRVLELVKDDLAAITVDHILAAARDGDGVAVSVIRDTAKYLAMAAANIVAIVDPEVLVLGGLIVSSPDLLLEQVRIDIRRRLPPTMDKGLTIVGATLGDAAPAIGAARLAAPAFQ